MDNKFEMPLNTPKLLKKVIEINGRPFKYE